jgi:ABC-type dipeptide/oligopeptide/nickel transport system permease component
MSMLLLLAPALSLAILAAHFYRAGTWWLALASAVLLALLALPRAWVARLVQLCLLAGGVEWLRTAFALVQQRIALGQPWTRLVGILVVVALLTAVSALVFRDARIKARYGLR